MFLCALMLIFAISYLVIDGRLSGPQNIGEKKHWKNREKRKYVRKILRIMPVKIYFVPVKKT